MKRFFTFFFALLSACTFSAYAAIIEGTCGDNLTWTLNTKDSTLVISGTGEMTDYYYSVPWSDYRSYIKYVTLPDGLTSIGSKAFSSCSKLTSITIPNSVTSIGDETFGWCSDLNSITIPNSVTHIGSGVFVNCTSLTSVVLSENMTSLSNTEDMEWLGFFQGCSSLISITIPNSVTSIGSMAFKDCTGLTSVTIPNSVTSIERYAFSGCSGLTSITIPNCVSIGEWAFSGCSGLTSITLGNSITSIGRGAFEDCYRLTSITIPNSLTSIGDNAFAGCYGIQEVTSYAATPPNAIKCGLNHTSCTLYVPAEYLEAYQNAVWWEDFAKIRAIGSDWDVEFVDWDGTILATMKVPDGEAATAPDAPTREGYTFIGWDKDFSSVTEDMTVTAQYQINRYGVRFYDWDDTLLKTDSVDYQSAATAPAAPTRLGYTFIGWDKDFSSITADLDVHAQYEAGADKEFEVIFSDQDNYELSAQSVTLRVPVAPQIAGFTFLYWKTIDARVDDVITLQAVYESKSPSAAPEVYVNPANPAQKLIRNGQVYILHEEKMYTISGQVVK